MKKIKVLILMILIFINCKDKSEEIITGNLYIKLVDLSSLYGLSKDKIDYWKNIVARSKEEEFSNKNDSIHYNYFKTLIKYDLLEKPCFKLKIFDGEIINVFTSEKEYLKLNNLEKKLNRDSEQIEIKFRGVRKEDNIYYTNDIFYVQKIKGKTDWDK